jgi:hypothetical protein
MFSNDELRQFIEWETITDDAVAVMKGRTIEELSKHNIELNQNIGLSATTFPQFGDPEEIQLKVITQQSSESHYLVKISYSSGKISEISKTYKSDLQDIIGQNEIVGLPFKIDGMILDYDKYPTLTIDGISYPLELNFEKISETENNLPPKIYRPLYKACVDTKIDDMICTYDDYDKIENYTDDDLVFGDDYCARLKAYDDTQNGIYGLLLSRMQYGHNPYIGLLDVRNKKIDFIKGGGNYDYPEIYCFKIKNDKEVEAYLVTSTLKSDLLYRDENYRTVLTIDNFYGACRWSTIL